MRSKLALTMGRLAKAAAQAKATNKNVWLSDDIGYRGPGRLVARVSPSTSLFYFRHCVAGRRPLVPIGPYSVTAKPGYVTLEEARDTAQRWSLAGRQAARPAPNTGDNGQSPPASSVPTQGGESSKATAAGKPPTLLEICCAYGDLLSQQGKSSARQVKNTFKLYIASHKLASQPASHVTAVNRPGFPRHP
jgi:hypothetical protein